MRWPSVLLYCGLVVYGIGFSFSPTLFSGFERLQTDAGDTVFNHYVLEHSWRCLSQRDYIGSVWSPAFYYPEKNVLAYSDNLFGAAPAYWSLRCIFSEVLAYQLWMILGFVLDFLAMAVVLRWFRLDHSLCALGAFLFAFGLPHVQQIGHQQTIYRCWTPLALWYGWHFVRDPSASLLFRCLLCIVWQCVAGIYVGWFLAFGAGIWGIVLLLGDHEFRTRLRRLVRTRPLAVGGAVVVNGLLLAALVIPYVRANQGFQRDFVEVMHGLPHWGSWFSVPPGTLWDSSLQSIRHDMGGESYICGGLTFVVLGVACVVVLIRTSVDEERVLIRSAAISFLLFIALSLVFWIDDDGGLSLWYGVYELVPGAKAIRIVARIYVILYPMLTIGGLLALQLLLRRSAISRPIKSALVGALILLAAAENHYPQRDDSRRAFVAELFYARARQIGEEIRGSDAAYGESDFFSNDYQRQLTMMWAGLFANIPVVNGYSGRFPNNYYSFSQDKSTIDRLKQWLGPGWHGRLAIIDNDDPPRREVWRVEESGARKKVE